MSKEEYFTQDFNRLKYFHGEVTSQAYLIGVCEFKVTYSKNGCEKKKG